jgi:hypothetical protein
MPVFHEVMVNAESLHTENWLWHLVAGSFILQVGLGRGRAVAVIQSARNSLEALEFSTRMRPATLLGSEREPTSIGGNVMQNVRVFFPSFLVALAKSSGQASRGNRRGIYRGLAAVIACGFLFTVACGQQATMQFPVERDTDILGWDNHDGWGDPPVYDKALTVVDPESGLALTEEFSNHGAAAAIRGLKSTQHASIMDWNTDNIKSFLAANADPNQPMTWTFNVYPLEGPSADVEIHTLESLNDWLEGDSQGTFTNFTWSEGTGAVTVNFAQTYYTVDADGDPVLDQTKSLPWIENQTGTGGINDNQYSILGRPDNFAKGLRMPDFINSELLTLDELGDAASQGRFASVNLDSNVVNAILNDANNRGIIFGPATGFPNENWRIWTREGSGLLDDQGGPTPADTIPGPVAAFLEVTYTPRTTPSGDFNGNGVLDLPDVNLLNGAIAGAMNPAQFDLNADTKVDQTDLAMWVSTLKRTWFGDADLNGEFNTGDLVAVFTAGKFEQNVDAGWQEGDWTGDLRFGTGDLVRAFTDGGFERGPKAAAVPEPTGPLCAVLAFGLILVRMRSSRVAAGAMCPMARTRFR